jgi:hypothetical protein
MKIFYTIVSAAIIALAGCSSNPAQVAPPLNAAQNHAAPYQTNSRSWMLSRARSMNLLYVSDQDAPGKLLAFSYPQDELVGEVTVPSDYPGGLCSDGVGDVFVTTFGPYSQSYVYEYAHGGTEPIATLVDPGDSNGCAIDPKTGDLAVTNFASNSRSGHYGNIAIYQGAQGTPTTYVDDQIINYYYCAYDDKGDLLVDGAAQTPEIGELPYGAGKFTNISLTSDIAPLSMQWLKGVLVVSASTQSKFGPQPIYNIRISGTNGIVTGPTLLKSPHDLNPFQSVQFWSQGKTIVGPDWKGHYHDLLNFWRSTGGWPKKIIRRPGGAVRLHGVTMSSAPPSSVRRLRSSKKRVSEVQTAP